MWKVYYTYESKPYFSRNIYSKVFLKGAKQNNFQVKIEIGTGGIVGLAEGILYRLLFENYPSAKVQVTYCSAALL